MVSRVSPSLPPQQPLVYVLLKDKVVQIALLNILFVTIVYVVNTLVGRVTKNNNNAEAKKCVDRALASKVAGDFKVAEQHLKTASDWKPSNENLKDEISIGLVVVGRITKSVNNAKAEGCFREALASYDAEDFPKAHEQFKQALDCEPSNENLKAEIRLGLALSTEDKYKALEYMTLVIGSSVEEESILTKAHQLRADLYLSAKYYPGVLKDLEYVLLRAKREEKGEILARIAQAHCGMNNHEEALQKSREALDLMPPGSYCDLYTGLSNICLVLNNPAQALKYLELGLKRVGTEKCLDRAIFLSQRARIYDQYDNKTNQAKEDLDQALLCDLDLNRQSIILLMRGRIYMNNGQHPEALKDFQKAQQCPSIAPEVLDPILKEILLEMDAYVEQKNFGEALKYLELALALVGPEKSPNRAVLLTQRVQLYAQEGKIDTALKDIEEALQCPLGPDKKSHLLLIRGQINKHKGQRRLALKDFEDALDCQPTNSKLQNLILEEMDSVGAD